MTEKEKARRAERYADYQLAYAALIAVYPFSLEDIEGEKWIKIPYNEEYYQISTYGRVKSSQNGKVKILKPCLNTKGYLCVFLFKNKNRKIFTIHQLVADAFIPNPDNKPEVDHKFNNKFDNYFENLRRVTSSENKKYAYETGAKKSGQEHQQAKLTNEQVRWIRKNYIPGDSEFGQGALAKNFDMSQSAISFIISGRSYKHVKDDEKKEDDK